ncbi:MAG: CCA tRNA nucleotidyltransferase [Verrucomicrobia bacterium]|nr:CCA tRNA nucleotidyltransferase [Verrucomicrobiota bacterium]
MKPRPPHITDLACPTDAPLAILARKAVHRLQSNGCVAYWAGGCVRDLLLGRSPKDFDIATDAPPDRVLAIFPGSVAVGKSFGVVRVPFEDAWFEVATFRQDHAYRDGRHPESVTFTDARKDATRRDFTINALFCDPIRETCIDYVQGRADLRERIIRAVGDTGTRFDEDHLRLLRAVRFAHTLGFAIESETEAAIRHAAPLVARVTPERIRDELSRIFVESLRPGAALETLDDLGLLAPILPEVVALKGQAQPPEFHPEGDVFTHTVIMLNLMDPPTAHLAFAILLHDIGKPPTATTDANGRIRFNGHDAVGADMATDILRRLRFSNDDIDAIGRDRCRR